jgi:hypothetical protein
MVHWGSMYKDIATIVADKCVNPDSNRPYPVLSLSLLVQIVEKRLLTGLAITV